MYRTASVQVTVAGLSAIKWTHRVMHNIDLTHIVSMLHTYTYRHCKVYLLHCDSNQPFLVMRVLLHVVMIIIILVIIIIMTTCEGTAFKLGMSSMETVIVL